MAFGDFTVTRSTTKWVLNSSGVLSEVAINTPAFEFNSDGTYRGLLVEPAGTNSIRNNTNVGAVAGTPGTLPTNWTESLSGLTRSIVATGSENGIDYIDIGLSGTASGTLVTIGFESNSQIVASSGQTWTNSVWVKFVATPTAPDNVRLNIREGTSAGVLVVDGEQTITPNTTLSRYSFTRTLAGGVTVERVNGRIYFGVTNGASYDFTVRIGLPQTELGSVATSVIKTTGSTANRTADSVTLTGASSLIGQTQGTVYVDIEQNTGGNTDNQLVTLSDSTANNRIAIRGVANRQFEARIVSGGATQAIITSAVLSGVFYRLAIAYATDDISFYINGTQVGTDTLATIPATSQVNLGTNTAGTGSLNGWIRSVAIFPSRLANATLATLTT